jgi:hypothetical protein
MVGGKNGILLGTIKYHIDIIRHILIGYLIEASKLKTRLPTFEEC